jgi:hypothetical protein
MPGLDFRPRIDGPFSLDGAKSTESGDHLAQATEQRARFREAAPPQHAEALAHEPRRA